MVSILPILHADFVATGNKSKLIVAEEYAQIPMELDYLETVIYPGGWSDLTGAIKFAKEKFGFFYSPQMHSESFLPRRMRPSFQLDQWDRCGRLDQWGKLPLVMPRLGGDVPENPFILFADASQSSPFDHSDDLASSLAVTFPSHQIVRTSSIRTPRLLDFVSLYDAADLIVSIDTLHLHLCHASNTPLIALATDKPSRWHGSAFHPRMSLYVRYGDYGARKAEILHVAKQLVNKSPVIRVETFETANKYGYNMSVLRV